MEGKERGNLSVPRKTTLNWGSVGLEVIAWEKLRSEEVYTGSQSLSVDFGVGLSAPGRGGLQGEPHREPGTGQDLKEWVTSRPCHMSHPPLSSTAEG